MRLLLIVLAAFVSACLALRAYNTFGWHYFEMPYPDWIAPVFHLGGEAHDDAVEIEVLIEFFVGFLALIGLTDWALRLRVKQKSNPAPPN